jgi:hypothetical protein
MGSSRAALPGYLTYPPYPSYRFVLIFGVYPSISVVPCIPPRQFLAPRIYLSATHLRVRPRLSQVMGPGPGLCLLLLRTSPLALPLYPKVLIVRRTSARLDRRTPCTAHTRHRPNTRAANERTVTRGACVACRRQPNCNPRTATSAECSCDGCIVRLELERTNDPIRLPPRHCEPREPTAAEAPCEPKPTARTPERGLSCQLEVNDGVGWA